MRVNHRLLQREIGRLFILLIVACVAAPSACGQEKSQPLSTRPPAAAADLTPAQEDEIISLLPVVPPGLNGQVSLQAGPPKTVPVSFTWSLSLPFCDVNEWEVFLVYPPDLPRQKILNLRTEPPSEVVQDLSPLRRKLLRVSAHAEPANPVHAFRYNLSFDAMLWPLKLVLQPQAAGTAQVPVLNAVERKLALRPGRALDYMSPQFAAWLDKHQLHRAQQEGEVHFARRVFLVIVKNYTYTSKPTGRASLICADTSGDCNDLSLLFVAALRSQGVPARVLVGRWAVSSEPKEVPTMESLRDHVKAEFFAQGVGWVPVDPLAGAEAVQLPERLAFFGNDPGRFIVLKIDPVVVYQTTYCGKQISKSGQPFLGWWVQGSGSFDEAHTDEEWTVKDAAVDKTSPNTPSSGPAGS